MRRRRRPAPGPETTAGGAGIHLVRSDLDFILNQIKIAEAACARARISCRWSRMCARPPACARSTASFNNLINFGGVDQTEFGAADNVFPRLTDPVFRDAEGAPAGFFGPAAQRSRLILQADQRHRFRLAAAHHLQSHRRSDRQQSGGVCHRLRSPGADGVSIGITADDVLKEGVQIVTSPGLDGQFGTADDKEVFFFENVAPDAGLSAPFNAWMTFFGQFFDHGLDLVTKGGSGTIFIPLKPDDPLLRSAAARPISWC